MNYQEYIDKLKSLQNKLLNFIDNDDNVEEYYQTFIDFITTQNIQTDKHDLKLLLYLILQISKNHYRGPNFFSKIKQILQYLNEDLKKNFSNFEIFNFFKSSKSILLFLIKEKTIAIDQTIYKIITSYKYHNKKYYKFFYPEIKPFIEEEKQHKSDIINNFQERSEKILNELMNVDLPDDFENKREIGENEDEICKLIRNDSIEEFIIYVNKNNFSLTSSIKSSIFETNQLFLKKKVLLSDSYMSIFENDDNPTLIEYAAFFGSVQIFKYLYKNKVELTPSLWIYAVHSDNAELISILEDNKIKPEFNNYNECLKESIKCHHINITNYIINNNYYCSENIEKSEYFIKYIFDYCFNYYNFEFLPNDIDNDSIFLYACKYDYYFIVDFFLKTKKINLVQEVLFNI